MSASKRQATILTQKCSFKWQPSSAVGLSCESCSLYSSSAISVIVKEASVVLKIPTSLVKINRNLFCTRSVDDGKPKSFESGAHDHRNDEYIEASGSRGKNVDVFPLWERRLLLWKSSFFYPDDEQLRRLFGSNRLKPLEEESQPSNSHFDLLIVCVRLLSSSVASDPRPPYFHRLNSAIFTTDSSYDAFGVEDCADSVDCGEGSAVKVHSSRINICASAAKLATRVDLFSFAMRPASSNCISDFHSRRALNFRFKQWRFDMRFRDHCPSSRSAFRTPTVSPLARRPSDRDHPSLAPSLFTFEVFSCNPAPPRPSSGTVFFSTSASAFPILRFIQATFLPSAIAASVSTRSVALTPGSFQMSSSESSSSSSSFALHSPLLTPPPTAYGRSLEEQLALIGHARRAVGTFCEQLDTLQRPHQELTGNVSFIRQCHDLISALDSERRQCADQLCVVNTELSKIEDAMKNTRNDYESKKSAYVLNLAKLQLNIIQTNELSRAAGIPNEYLLDQNAFAHFQHIPNSDFVLTLMNPTHPLNVANSRRQQSNIVPEKDCQNCKKRIHRNAPVCAWCKTKASSKPKSKLKRLQPGKGAGK
ncbi:hypothetical protein L596_018458 [Steinernema carpocapsae]|uniref:C4H2-type domain-containing protein n=1 Tax=Steinernema carpocapsae TaxID=34508 RepID=A0A4U5N565_STECR|nr:hypothetical protein L596_018458 [Steinernema carpocapsae]